MVKINFLFSKRFGDYAKGEMYSFIFKKLKLKRNFPLTRFVQIFFLAIVLWSKMKIFANFQKQVLILKVSVIFWKWKFCTVCARGQICVFFVIEKCPFSKIAKSDKSLHPSVQGLIFHRGMGETRARETRDGGGGVVETTAGNWIQPLTAEFKLGFICYRECYILCM